MTKEKLYELLEDEGLTEQDLMGKISGPMTDEELMEVIKQAAETKRRNENF